MHSRDMLTLMLAAGACAKKDTSHHGDNIIPSPWSSKTPNPDDVSVYGEYGLYRDGWNGQYYPFASFGYGDAVRVGSNLSPYYFAGPFGFYGPYGNENATVSEIYVNGSQAVNGTSIGGTLYNLTYSDGVYTIYATKGSYLEGSSLEVAEEGNHTLDAPDYRVAYNGTFLDQLSPAHTAVINVNVTANGTFLHSVNKSDLVQSKNGAPITVPEWKWAPAALGAVALLM